MAEISVIATRVRTMGDQAHIHSWANMANGDTGVPIAMPGSSDRSVQVEGTFGAGGSCTIEGSNDGVNYRPLTDPQGNNLVFTAAKIELVMELVAYIRPHITAGDGSTSLTVSMLVKK